MKDSSSRFLTIRGLRHHVREWGREGARKLFMLHGWGDVSASFQFVVDAFEADWHVFAPDWRGFGLSGWSPGGYWFPEYLADLEAVLDHLAPDEAVNLVGHSLGGNVACLYAGVRPQRIARLAALDAFGLPGRAPEEAPARLETWLDQLKVSRGFRVYSGDDAFAARLMRDNPRLTPERAAFLAKHLGTRDDAGGVRIAADPLHRNLNPVLYRRHEAEACWRGVEAPVLGIVQESPDWRRAMGVDDAMHEAATACFRDYREVVIADSGHNFHHDQPERTAATLEAFFLSEPAGSSRNPGPASSPGGDHG
ncbi:MAG: alpha/beta hydrolase [Rhodocyclaceae bacterium]|nr:alpha/beta hydrolase [Rhodocyclaceae bacterium]MCL4757643.1 alpha/beta hydrolase [Rhodocyclaceae bacterium]